MLHVMGKPAEQTGWKFVLWNSPYRISLNKTHEYAVLIFFCVYVSSQKALFNHILGAHLVPFEHNLWTLIWIPPFDKMGKNPSKAAWLTIFLIHTDQNLMENNSNSPEFNIPWNCNLLFYLIVLSIIPYPFQTFLTNKYIWTQLKGNTGYITATTTKSQTPF